MRPGPSAATKTWNAQKGVQHQDTYGRGCVWYASTILVTAGTAADCTVATQLIGGLTAQCLLADRGYDTNEIIAIAQDSGIEAIIPPKKNRKAQRDDDHYLYKL